MRRLCFTFDVNPLTRLQWLDVLERAILKAEKMGFLHRKETGIGGRSPSWRSRWFVLRGQQLLMYADKSQDKPKDTISLLAASGIEELPYDVRDWPWRRRGVRG